MEPVHIHAAPGPTGLIIESFDADELFEKGGAALSQADHDAAIAAYEKLLKHFPASPLARPTLYNLGLAHRDKKAWLPAMGAFRLVAERYPEHADARDAMFQLGACQAESADWSASLQTFTRLLERGDLSADDRVEAMARRGFAHFSQGDFSAADKAFRGVQAYRDSLLGEERLATDFFLAFSQYHLAQISHHVFRATPLRMPEPQLERDLEEKAAHLLRAQRHYIDTIKFGNPRWASAAGFQVGALYEEMHAAFLSAPVPPELSQEAREIYLDELRRKVRVLLEKSLRWQRENLLMIERLGLDTDWAEKSRASHAKLVRLLEGLPPEPATLPGAGGGPPPEIPVLPGREIDGGAGRVPVRRGVL
jgi:tetratricopeptide (TPR) repeat protein